MKSGDVGRRHAGAVAGPELERRDVHLRHVFEPHVDLGRAVGQVPIRGTHLSLDRETARDGLLRLDGPGVVLVDRERNVERRGEVVAAHDLRRAFGFVGDLAGRDLHGLDVGRLLQRQGHLALRDVDLRVARKPFGGDAFHRTHHDRVGNVVLDTAGQRQRQGQYVETESFHGVITWGCQLYFVLLGSQSWDLTSVRLSSCSTDGWSCRSGFRPG